MKTCNACGKPSEEDLCYRAECLTYGGGAVVAGPSIRNPKFPSRTSTEHTVRVSCDCKVCETNASKVGATFPLVAFIRPQAAEGLGVTERNANKAAKVHGFVWSAYDPSQSRMAAERRFSVPA